MDSNKLSELLSNVDRCYGQLEYVRESLISTKKELSKTKKEIEYAEKARAIIQKVAKETQQQVQMKVSSLATMGMNAVFDDPYEMELQFVERRNKTELDFVFKRNGHEFSPLDSSGGGAIDVATLTLQICMLSIHFPKKRMILVMDEPLKWLKGKDYPERGAQLIKEISDKLGIQIIMISHDPQLIDSADRIFEIT